LRNEAKRGDSTRKGFRGGAKGAKLRRGKKREKDWFAGGRRTYLANDGQIIVVKRLKRRYRKRGEGSH